MRAAHDTRKALQGDFGRVLRNGVAALVVATGMLFQGVAAQAEPLKIVVGFAAGSGLDLLARVIAEKAQRETGETIIVENRPGAGGRIAAQLVATAQPDGRTILMCPIVTTAFTPFMYKKPGFDALKDLAPITRLGNFKFAIGVKPDFKADSLKDFIAYVKANPKTVGYSTPGVGTPAHFLGVMFNKATGTDLLHVPYKGSGPAATAVLSGDVLSTFNTTVALIPLYRDKKVKLLAVTGTRRSAELPDIPVLSELGLDLGDVEKADFWYGFFAPGATEPGVIATLNKLLVDAIKDPAVTAKIAQLDIEVITDTPDGFKKIVAEDYERWGKVIGESGFAMLD